MKPANAYEEFYKSQLTPLLENLEGKRLRYQEIRKKINRNAGRYALGTIVVLPVAIFVVARPSIFSISDGLRAFLIVATMITIVGGAIFSHKKWAKGQKELMGDASPKNIWELYINSVIKNLIAFTEPSFQYAPSASIPSQEFWASKVLPKSGIFESGAVVAGKVMGTEFKFANVKIKRSSKNGYYTVFNGVFWSAPVQKDFLFEIIVLPNLTRGTLGEGLGKLMELAHNTELGHNATNYLLSTFIGAQSSVVSVGNPEFEREYVVYCEDANEAQRILTPETMERVLSLQKKAGKAIHLSFVRSTINIVFESIELFMPLINTPFAGPEQAKLLKVYHDYLELIAGLVEDLGLTVNPAFKATPARA